MALDGSGNYSLPQPQYPAIAGTIIEAADWNQILDDIASVLSKTVYVDGQAVMEAALKMGNFKILNLATGAADTDAVNYAQVFKNPTFTSTAGNDVTVLGEEFVVDPTTFTVTPDALAITVLTLAISATTTLTISSSTDITLSATDDIFISPTDDLVVTAQDVIMTATTITFNGATKADLTATSTAPNQALTANGTEIVNMFTLNQVAMQASLPTLTGNEYKVLRVNASGVVEWASVINTTTVKPAVGTDFATTTGTQTLKNKNYEAAVFQDPTDTTKKASFNLSAIAAATTRTVTLKNKDMTLFTPMAELLLTVIASNSATVDLENVFTSAYDKYLIEVDNLTIQTSGALQVRFKIGGSYQTTGYLYKADSGSILAGNNVFDSLANAVNCKGHFSAKLQNPDDTALYHALSFEGVSGTGSTTNGGDADVSSLMVQNNVAGALTGIRFLMASGNILTGNFKVYGISG